ncbi:MAG: ThiF family adenylyltransferase [Lautropia sp.]
MDRYARHRAIDGFSQPALQASRFAVVGAGAIGNEVVKNLCLLGVGRIDLYDLDTVELHNLTRSVLLREADVGSLKAQSVARRAAELDPAVVVKAIPGDVWQTLDFGALREYCCVIGALDNFEARMRLNLLCWIAGVDWINAAIDSRYVTVESFPFATTAVTAPAAAGAGDSRSDDGRHDAGPPACYECGLPSSVYRQIAERYSCGGLQRAAARRRIVPTTTITASLAGAQAVNSALRSVAPGGPPGQTAQRWLLDTSSGLATVARLMPSPSCPACGGHRHNAPILPVPGGTAGALDVTARSLPVESFRLSDALIWRCHCVNCGVTEATRAVELQPAGHIPDTVTFCTRCRSEAIMVQIRDDFDVGELSERFGPQTRVPARFAMAAGACLDLQAS